MGHNSCPSVPLLWYNIGKEGIGLEDIRFIEDIKLRGNFWFLHNINKELYEQLSSAERIARINFRECGSLTRDILETMVGYFIRDYYIMSYRQIR